VDSRGLTSSPALGAAKRSSSGSRNDVKRAGSAMDKTPENPSSSRPGKGRGKGKSKVPPVTPARSQQRGPPSGPEAMAKAFAEDGSTCRVPELPEILGST
ncbi:unnamed protein product, partial [Polarella glacialis]